MRYILRGKKKLSRKSLILIDRFYFGSDIALIILRSFSVVLYDTENILIFLGTVFHCDIR